MRWWHRFCLGAVRRWADSAKWLFLAKNFSKLRERACHVRENVIVIEGNLERCNMRARINDADKNLYTYYS